MSRLYKRVNFAAKNAAVRDGSDCKWASRTSKPHVFQPEFVWAQACDLTRADHKHMHNSIT